MVLVLCAEEPRRTLGDCWIYNVMAVDHVFLKDVYKIYLLILSILLDNFGPWGSFLLLATTLHSHFLCSQIPCCISNKETLFARTHQIGAIRQSPAAASSCTLPGQETVVDLISPSHFFRPTSPTPVLVSRMRSGPAAVLLSVAFLPRRGMAPLFTPPHISPPSQGFLSAA